MTSAAPDTSTAVTAAAAMRPFSRSLPMSLLSARETSMRFFRPLLAEHELTEQQWRVLRALGTHDADAGPVDASRLAEMTCLLPPSLSRILENLDKRGLLTRTIDPTDQRRSHLTLSEKGQAKVAEIAPESERRYAQIEASFGVQRLAELLAELDALTIALDAHHVDAEEAVHGDD